MHFVNMMMAHAIPLFPRALIQRFSRRYIAGQDLTQAAARIQRLNEEGFPVTVDILGESVTTAHEADIVMREYEAALEAIERLQLRATISIKPTAMGMHIDSGSCQSRIQHLLHRANQLGTEVCLDMEDISCTQMEIDLFLALSRQHKNIGIAIQAYLKRTHQDLDVLIGAQARLRICKGIYVEDPVHLVKGASSDRSAINPHFLSHATRCFESGHFLSIATHDRLLIEAVLALAKQLGIQTDRFEFQMLLGVCEALRNDLLARGFQVRIYVPYGKDWYGYSIRRLKENPRIAGYLAQALINF